ncbi:MAG TPA: DUF1579 family protein [Terriglobales bacterium]|nr:DUF1579 family protein [Terriglobales bacterium]
MKRVAFAALPVLVLAALSAFGQMPMPKPGPEVKKLDYFVGSWTMEGEMKPGPMGPGGKFTGSETDEWMPGGFFLEAHEEFKTPMGDGTAKAFMGYDTEGKMYTYHSFASTGESENSTGMLEGDTWNWTSDEKMGGQTLKGKYSLTMLSPTSYSFKFEVSPDGTTWNTVMEGKATKK